MDRAFRIGQQRTVEVYRMIGLGTLEELKYERQSKPTGVDQSSASLPISSQTAAVPAAQ